MLLLHLPDLLHPLVSLIQEFLLPQDHISLKNLLLELLVFDQSLIPHLFLNCLVVDLGELTSVLPLPFVCLSHDLEPVKNYLILPFIHLFLFFDFRCCDLWIMFFVSSLLFIMRFLHPWQVSLFFKQERVVLYQEPVLLLLSPDKGTLRVYCFVRSHGWQMRMAKVCDSWDTMSPILFFLHLVYVLCLLVIVTSCDLAFHVAESLVLVHQSTVLPWSRNLHWFVSRLIVLAGQWILIHCFFINCPFLIVWTSLPRLLIERSIYLASFKCLWLEALVVIHLSLPLLSIIFYFHPTIDWASSRKVFLGIKDSLRLYPSHWTVSLDEVWRLISQVTIHWWISCLHVIIQVFKGWRIGSVPSSKGKSASTIEVLWPHLFNSHSSDPFVALAIFLEVLVEFLRLHPNIRRICKLWSTVLISSGQLLIRQGIQSSLAKSSSCWRSYLGWISWRVVTVGLQISGGLHHSKIGRHPCYLINVWIIDLSGIMTVRIVHGSNFLSLGGRPMQLSLLLCLIISIGWWTGHFLSIGTPSVVDLKNIVVLHMVQVHPQTGSFGVVELPVVIGVECHLPSLLHVSCRIYIMFSI